MDTANALDLSESEEEEEFEDLIEHFARQENANEEVIRCSHSRPILSHTDTVGSDLAGRKTLLFPIP